MRDRTERFSILPFSSGCVSQSSVAVCDPKRPEAETSSAPSTSANAEGEEEIISSIAAGKSAKGVSFLGLLPLPRPNISVGIQRLIKSLKNLSGLFSAFEGRDEDGDDNDDEEMDIGLPTDVQHLAHIGPDGFGNMMWDKSPDGLPLPPFSARQFELAMPAKAGLAATV